jgi:hypothetical protein
MIGRIFFLFLLFNQSLMAQYTAAEPTQGWDSWKKQLVSDNPEMDSILNRVGFILGYYNLTVTKKGVLKHLEVLDSAPLNGQSTQIIASALRKTTWKPATRKDKPKSSEFPIIMDFVRRGSKYTPSEDTAAIEFPKPIKRDSTSVIAIQRSDSFARYPGGHEAFSFFIASNFSFPARCAEEGIEGYVLIKFRINPYGEIKIVSAENRSPACPEFAAEAIRVVLASSTWIPGVYNGKYISAHRILPIRLNTQ